MNVVKKIRVGPTDTDSYNIVHHPQYFIWIEEAILEWLLSTFGNLHQISYEIGKFQCKFISPGILYDNLLLQLNPKGRKSTGSEETVKFQVRMFNEETKHSVIEADFFVAIKGNENG